MNGAALTWRALWDDTATRVGNRQQARWLCEEASGAFGNEFHDVLDDGPTDRMLAHLDAMLARLSTGEPLQYVLGRWSFRHLDLMVDRRVLIPRPETEVVAGAAIDELVRLGARRGRTDPWAAGRTEFALEITYEGLYDLSEETLADGSSTILDDHFGTLGGWIASTLVKLGDLTFSYFPPETPDLQT